MIPVTIGQLIFGFQEQIVTYETVDEESVRLFYRVFESSIEAIRGFCNNTPGFTELDKRDQDILFQAAIVELFVLRFAYRSVFIHYPLFPKESNTSFCSI